MKSAWNIYQGQKGCKTDDGELVNSGDFSGLISTDARKKITEHVGGKLVSTYRLRDWGISRQRYWGCPIPIVYDPEGVAHSVPDEHLPWILPTDVDHTPDGTAPLARSKELLERTEKIFGKGWRPEVETMDTFVDSSWYFYRYLDNKNDSEFASEEKMKSWMPIDLYMGGAEHTTMHLLYSRFWVKALYDLGLVKDDEAYTVRRNRGIILGIGGVKMSKSKPETVINPDEIVERLGTDTVRMYLAFMGPYGVTTNYPWDPNGVVGVRRFLERVSKLSSKVVKSGTTDSKSLHKTIKGITEDIEGFKFNTAISKMMILLNSWEKAETIAVDDFKLFLQLLAPFAPHLTEELWINVLNEKESIHISNWPKYNPALIVDDEVTIVIQVNGKVRGSIVVPLDSLEEVVKTKAESEESVKKHLVSVPKKVIYVKNKLISFVL
jgi:leucyl-tRNA synthetase